MVNFFERKKIMRINAFRLLYSQNKCFFERVTMCTFCIWQYFVLHYMCLNNQKRNLPSQEWNSEFFRLLILYLRCCFSAKQLDVWLIFNVKYRRNKRSKNSILSIFSLNGLSLIDHYHIYCDIIHHKRKCTIKIVIWIVDFILRCWKIFSEGILSTALANFQSSDSRKTRASSGLHILKNYNSLGNRTRRLTNAWRSKQVFELLSEILWTVFEYKKLFLESSNTLKKAFPIHKDGGV